MWHLTFEPCKADPDVWIRKSIKADGSKYYEYALLHVDDLLVVSENAENAIWMKIGKYFELKEASIGMPDICLGGMCPALSWTMVWWHVSSVLTSMWS